MPELIATTKLFGGGGGGAGAGAPSAPPVVTPLIWQESFF